jgi:hypothetical protein
MAISSREAEAGLARARALLSECRIRALPVDLGRLARQVGIRRIRELDIRLDGQLLELEEGGFEVLLSRSAPRSRRRFTLAHEIAHVLLSPKDAGCSASRDSEELCNLVAAELLMPAAFLERLFPARRVDLASFLRASRLCQCSFEAAGWRLFNSGLGAGTLLIWKLRQEPEEFLELLAAPRTYRWPVSLLPGARLYPGNPLWERIMKETRGSFALAGVLPQRELSAEWARLGTVVLLLARDEGGGGLPLAEATRRRAPSASAR